MPFGRLGFGLGFNTRARSLGGGSAFTPNSISGLMQLLFVDEQASLSGYITDERTGLGDDRARRGGWVYNLDGVNDNVLGNTTLRDLCSYSNTWTVIFSVNVKSLPATYATLLDSVRSASDRVQCQIDSSGFVRATLYNGTTFINKSTVAISTGAWRTIALVNSGASLSIYLDGVLQSGTSGAVTAASPGFSFGANVTGTSPANAYMHNMRIYNVAKDASEIAAIVAGDYAAPDTTGLVAGYWCNEEDGTTSYDWSGNGNHGTITNATLATFHAVDDTVENPADLVGYGLRQEIYGVGSPNWDQNSGLVFSEPLTGDFSISTTINAIAHSGMFALQPTVIPVGATLFAQAGSIGVQIINSTTVRRWIADTSVDFPATITTSSTFNYTRVGSTITFSVDGVSAFTTTSADTLYRAYWFSSTPLRFTKSGDDEVGYVGTKAGITTSYVPRDESGTANDVLGNALEFTGEAPNPGQAVNSPCLTLDSVNDRVVLATQLSFSGQFAVAFWVNPATNAVQAFTGRSDNSNASIIYNGAAGNITVETNTASSTAFSTALTTNTWQHIAISRTSGNAITVYKNGVSVGTQTVTGTLQIGQIGARNGTTPTMLYSGRLCDVRAYDTDLSAAEVEYIYTGGRSGTDPTLTDLSAWLPFGENSGTTAYNVADNTNNGTLTNMTTSPAGTGAWVNTQDVFHYFLSKGGTLSTGTETSSTFDSDLDGWTSYWANVYWVASAHSMTGLAHIQAEDSNSNDARLGRTFTLGGDATLTVVSKYRGGDDGFSLLVKDNGATISTTSVPAYMGGVPSLNLSLSLTGAGEHIIEFVITGGNRDAAPGGWWIDSVTVTEGVVGLEIPALTDGTADAQGNAITNPARVGHNGGVTDLEWDGGTWSFNDAPADNSEFIRTLTSSSVDVAADRFAKFDTVLTGTDLTNMETYTETTEI